MASADPPPVRLELEVSLDEQRVSGRLRAAGDPAWSPFDGWVAMSGALVDTCEQARTRPPERPT